MENPFAYSNYVTGNSFCNRKKEIVEMLKYIKGSQNVLLYSHRRYGKSSLIRQIFGEIEKKNSKIGAMHVELYGTISEKDFITKTFQSLNQLESNFEKLLQSVNRALKSIRLNLSIDSATGGTSISPAFEAVNEKIILEELMNILSKYSQKHKLVIAFDEFQEVANYTEEGFEKRLRSYIQQHSNICYIFSGTIIETFENHPMYIQNFLFHLWEEPATRALSPEVIRKIEDAIVDKRSLEYSVLWETLTINQKKTLKLILLNNGSNLYNTDALKSVNLKTASLVTKALSSLIKKEIIVKNGIYLIQDIVFKKWLRKTLSF